MARGLLVRIFDELFAMGAVQRGDLVCDPFAGVGTTGIETASRGCWFIGCELEEKFVALARENFALHAATWAAMGRPQPVIVQGDSRRLREHIGPTLAECVVSSPPYAEQPIQGGGGNAYGAKREFDRTGVWPKGDLAKTAKAGSGYGVSPGQLGAMRAGDVDAVVSSPPYVNQSNTPRCGRYANLPAGCRGLAKASGEQSDYGETAGQLARLPEGAVADAIVSSPPWEDNSEGHVRGSKWKSPKRFLAAGRGHGCSDEARLRQLQRDEGKRIGDTDGQLGQARGETFWSAAAEIMRECHAILKPGGYAVWVTKAFIRKKQIVDFPGDWRKLCEASGFETIKEVHAMLVAEDRRTDLFGDERVMQTERKSFFRRLAESKGSPRIDYEVVWFTRRAG